jgi:hypothetical protein
MDYPFSQGSGISFNAIEPITTLHQVPPPNPTPGRIFSTEDLAQVFHVEPASIRSALSRSGHYMGLKPFKLPNRRLAWPANDVVRLLNGEEL